MTNAVKTGLLSLLCLGAGSLGISSLNTVRADGKDVVAATPPQPIGADHRDAPAINQDPSADINDVYAFVNPNNNNVVLAITINPFTAPGINVSFSNDVLYQFKIDTDGDFVEDLVFQATFNQAANNGSGQTFKVVGPVKPTGKNGIDKLAKDDAAATVTGAADGSIVGPDSRGIKVFAGRREDPFFIDFVFVTRLVGISPGGAIPVRSNVDFFAGVNTSILAIEVPPALIKGATSNTIRLWGTTSRPTSTKRSNKVDKKTGAVAGDAGAKSFVQVERMAFPLVNTTFIRGTRKNDFNKGQPKDDKANFRAEALVELVKINNDQAYSEGVIDAVLPDVLTLDVTKTEGFVASLNGRRPEDDVIDKLLQVVSKNTVLTDGANVNDRTFLTDFPFFAPENNAKQIVPARDQ